MAMEEAAVKKAIARVVDSRTHYGYSGHPHVKRFEEELSRMFASTVLGVNSGTDAIILALKLLGIKHGDEIIVPAFSFISTASPIPWVGATPIFIDIKADDYAIDPEKIEEKITPRTKAIIIAHLFGQPALGIEKIVAIAKKNNLFVIEDAAQSFGAKIKIGEEWRMVGTLGDIGCLSFSSTKPFSAPGNGGAVILNKKGLEDEADRIRSYGAKKHYYDYPTIGVNSKLQDIQAAALLAKLPFFEYWLDHRKKLSDYYRERLKGIEALTLQEESSDSRRTWYRFVIQTKDRDQLFKRIQTVNKNSASHPMINYPVPIPFFSAFKNLNYAPGDFPVAEHASKTVISLPITNYTGVSDAKLICDAVKSHYENSRI